MRFLRAIGFTLVILFLDASPLLPAFKPGSASERIYFNAKVFTGDPQTPYAEAVAIRGDKIIAAGNLAEVAKSVSGNAERVDLQGKSLFPGFIDSHVHPIMGGISLISADARSAQVQSVNDLVRFAHEAKKSGRGMRGDILEIQGLALKFWSQVNALNAAFSSGIYENQAVFLLGDDYHTGWANRTLLRRAGITRD